MTKKQDPSKSQNPTSESSNKPAESSVKSDQENVEEKEVVKPQRFPKGASA